MQKVVSKVISCNRKNEKHGKEIKIQDLDFLTSIDIYLTYLDGMRQSQNYFTLKILPEC